MTRIHMTAFAALMALTSPAAADVYFEPQGPEHDSAVQLIAGCPPGLAKKAVPCTPPGQAKKMIQSHDRDHYDRDHDRRVYQSDRYDRVYSYRVGDRINGDYIVLDSPGRYGLDPAGTYYRVDDQVFQVDRDTRQILGVIGLFQTLVN
ncbi:MAG: excinuclease ABC subunit A [Pseudomonadota bacterium]|nr:excinuclease ABC subunit A [Pseudomonadota bacterium]